MPRRACGLGRALLAAGLLAGCVTDHDSLAKRPDAGGGGAGGVAGSAGESGFGTLSGSGGGGGSGGKPSEPTGSNVFTLLHGVVDAPSVRACLLRVSDGGEQPLGAPLPDAPLQFGGAVVIDPPSGVDFATDVLRVALITGELERIDGLDCAQAIALAEAEQGAGAEVPEAGVPDSGDAGASGEGGADSASDAGEPDASLPDSGISGAGGAGGAAGAADAGGAAGEGGSAGQAGAGGSPLRPPSLRVAELPAIPAGTLSRGYSTLLVADGCMGGPAFAAPEAESYCGPGYTPEAPTLGAVFVVLSRSSSSAGLGLQVVHASLATGNLGLVTSPPPDKMIDAVTIVSRLEPGAIAPRPALIDYSRDRYGVGKDGYQVAVSLNGNLVLSEPWAEVIARGGLSDLADGQNYALVLIGPRADVARPPALWNAPAVSVVPASP